MRIKKMLATLSLAAGLAMGMTGCSNISDTSQQADRQYMEDDDNVEDLKGNRKSKNGGEAAEAATIHGITVFDIKSKYGVAGSAEIAPFYNIQQDTAFLFHFNSKVNPVCAVTVHTDQKCQKDSMVYQINDGYTNGNATDVIVKPGNPILNSDSREKLEDFNWGYAPIYYLCIHYDLTSDTVKKLDEPYIVPFTVQSGISTPNITAAVNENGQFEIQWDEVKNAVSYNIYVAEPVKDSSNAKGMSRSECAYIGDHLKLLTSVDAGSFSFNDFHCDETGNTLSSMDGYTCQENFYTLGTYYMTAVSKDGEESMFSLPAEGWKFSKSLPESFENQSVFQISDGCASILPEEVPVRMADGNTSMFPVSYKKIKEEDGHAVYEYKITGTLLNGQIKYKTDGQYEDEIISSKELQSVAYKTKNSINIIPENTVTTKQSEYVQLCTVSDYPKNGEKAEYSKDTYYERADMEVARIVLDGKYNDGAEPLAIFNNGHDTISENIQKNTPKETSTTMKNTTTTYGDEYMIFADSAEEEYLALCMSDTMEEISISDFPKLQNTQYLLDAIYKVIYQNPYIIGVKSFGYDADNAMLYISYAFNAETTRKKQSEIKTESARIIHEIIKDDMDDEEKVSAIWDYIEVSTVYDQKACDAASASGFSDIEGYEDSFSAYGIICKKKGVCQSYMHATKLLCQMAGIECKSVTGYIQNNLPHGWNIIKLEEKWYWIDTTNTMKNAGVPHFIYQTSYKFAAGSWNYVLDDGYALDDELSFAETEDIDKDWYYERGLFAESHKEILEIVKDKIKDNNGTLFIKCTFTPSIYDNEFVQGIKDALIECGYNEEEISNTRFGNIGQVMVIDTTGERF